MQELRTHTFVLSPKDIARAAKLAFPTNLRLQTMPAAVRISSDPSGVRVSWDVAVHPEPQMLNEIA